MSGNKYDGRVISIGNLLLKLKAADIRELHVQNQAAGKVRSRKGSVLGGRPKPVSAQASRRQEFTKQLADVLVVVHDEDDLLFGNHSDVLESAKRVNMRITRLVLVRSRLALMIET